MTIPQLKKSVDRRFERVDRRFQSVERRLDRIERTMATKADLKRLREDMTRSDARTRDELRRHFNVVAESLREDLRIFANGIAAHSDRLDRHAVRVTRLERLALSRPS